jgi:glycosyltransferase involved in cell wall biosynthesis
MSSAPPVNASIHRASGHRELVGSETAGVVIATLARGRGETGVHTHSRALRDGLSEAGLSCRLQTPFSGGAKWLPVFAVRPLFIYPLNKTWSTRWYRHWHLEALREQLIRDIRRQGTSAIVAQCPISASAALDAREQTGGSFPVAMVCHFNHSEAQEYRDKGELADEQYFQEVLGFEQSVLQRVDRVIYVSGWARRVVEQERGIRPRASSVIWNGIAGIPPPQRLRREDLGLNADHLVMINIGTLEPRKNQLGLVELFAPIAAEFPAARLLLVGNGPSRHAIQARIDQHGLQEKVKLLGFRTDVADLLGVADVYVHYAAMENCPMVLLEAGRAGLPLAAAASGGVPELLDELGGIPLDSSNPTQSLTALRPLLRDAHQRTETGRLTQQRFHRRFTREAMVRDYLRVLGLSNDEEPPSQS